MGAQSQLFAVRIKLESEQKNGTKYRKEVAIERNCGHHAMSRGNVHRVESERVYLFGSFLDFRKK